ncbi:HNH endonuclease, partial [Halorubrum tibetense]
NTRVHDKNSVIGIIRPCHRLRHAPTSTCKAEFVAEIDRIGRNGVGIIDTTSGHDIVVENVTEDDVGRLIEAELIETRLAKKVSDDPEIVSRLPSVSDIEDIETAERSEQSEDTDTKVSEKFSGSETASSESQTVSAEASDSQSVESESGTETQTVDELRKEAEEDAVEQVPQEATTNTSQTVQYTRSTKIKEYVKARADGVCEGCGEPAPFTSKTGDPYLHAHHVQELGDGGSDTPETVIALCPNCHYRVHHGKDGEDYNREPSVFS